MPSVTEFIIENDKENINLNSNNQQSLNQIDCQYEEISQMNECKCKEKKDSPSLDIISDANELVYVELKGFNFVQNINEIQNKMKINPKWLDLSIDIQFSSTHILISFASQINKIAKYTKKLKWNIQSFIKLGKYDYVVTEIIGLFKNIKKLDLIFDSINSFSKKGVILLFQQLKKLDFLSHLKLNVIKLDRNSQQSLIVHTLINDFEDEIISERIEWIQCNIFKSYSQKNFPSLSIYFCEKYVGQLDFDDLIKNITNIQTKLVEIVFSWQIIKSINDAKKIELIKQIIRFCKMLAELPYLTQTDLKYYYIYNVKLKGLLNLTNQYINDKRSKIQQAIVFYQQIAQWMYLNPRIIISDLWFN